jgi:hypothetical protein
MDPTAIDLAVSRVRTAGHAFEDLTTAKTWEEFGDHWFLFLVAWKAVYTVLEEGAKPFPQSRQWFGAKKKERKDDPLLQYLFEARNDEEHGLARSVTLGGPKLLIRGSPGQTHFQLGHDAQGRLTATGPKGEDVSDHIQHIDAGPELQPVKARGGRTIYPPCQHLSRPVDIRPLPVALAGLNYVAKLVAEAVKLRKPLP